MKKRHPRSQFFGIGDFFCADYAEKGMAVTLIRKKGIRQDLQCFMEKFAITGIEEADCHELVNTLERRIFSQGSRLLEQGRKVDQIGVLCSGAAHILAQAPGGEEIKCGAVRQGDLFGEMFFIADGLAVATIECTEPVVCYLANLDTMRRLVDKYPDMENYLYHLALDRLIKVHEVLNREMQGSRPPTNYHSLPRPLRHAMAFIENNYTEPLTLSVVAKQIGLSPYHFSRMFSRKTGYSFKAYLNQVRIEVAKQLMRDPSLNITEICFSVGFNDLSYFSRVFRKLEGISPSEYRGRIYG